MSGDRREMNLDEIMAPIDWGKVADQVKALCDNRRSEIIAEILSGSDGRPHS